MVKPIEHVAVYVKVKHFLNRILFLCLNFSVNVVQPEANQTTSHTNKLKNKTNQKKKTHHNQCMLAPLLNYHSET